MTTDLFYYVPTLPQIFTLGVTYFVFLTLILAGYAVLRHDRLISTGAVLGIAPLAGFGMAYAGALCLAFLPVDWAIPTFFALFLVLTWGVSLKNFFYTGALLKEWGPIFLLTLPFMLLVAGTDPILWDNFSHWLPAAQYVTELGHLPISALPAVHSNAGYPYGLALQNAAVNWLRGDFYSSVNPLMNILWLSTLLFWFPSLGRCGRFIWGSVFFLFLAALGASYVASSYADTLLAVSMAHIVLWGAFHVQTKPTFSRLWVGMALVALVPVAIKQIGLMLLFFVGIVLLAMHLLHLKQKTPSKVVNRSLAWLAVFAPAILFDRLWQGYLWVEGMNAGFSFHAPAQWHTEVIMEMFSAAWLYVVHAPWTFLWLPVLLLSVLLKRYTLSIAVLGVACLYVFFVFFAYITSFSLFEARTAASFSRYISALSLLGWLSVLLPWLDVLKIHLRSAAVLRNLTFFFTLIFIMGVWTLRDQLHSQGLPVFKVWDVLAQELQNNTESGSTILTVDAAGNGFIARYIAYKMNRHASLPMVNRYQGEMTAVRILARAEKENASYVFMASAPPALAQQIRLPLGDMALIKLIHNEKTGSWQWQTLKQWRL